MRKITEQEYRDAEGAYHGWCPDCDGWTRETTEPDAEGYDCPGCEGNNVVGALTALMSELFEIVE